MENQVLRRLRGLILWGALLLLWCQVTGCAGSVRGKIFLDQNGNGLLDPNESGIPQVKMSIIYKGKVEKTGYTTPAGTFSIRPKWQKGSVCVRIEEEVLANVIASGNLASSVLMPTKTFAAAITTTTAENGCTNGIDANRNGTCDDRENDEADNTDGGRDVDTTTTEQDDPPGWEDDTYCGSLKHGYLELNVPLAIDHEKAISEIPEPDLQYRYGGETFEQKITKPAVCDLKPLQLPSGFSLVAGGNPNISIDSNTNLLVFSSASTARVFRPTVKAAVTTTSASSPLDYANLMLKVDENISTEAKEVSIKPAVLCDGKPYDLPEIKYSIRRDVDLIVQNNILGNAPRALAPFTFRIEVKIRNIGKSPVSRGELVIALPDGIDVASDGMPENCRDLGQRASCMVTDLAPNSVTPSFVFKLDLPRSLEAATHYAILSSFRIEGFEREIAAENPVEFNLQP